MEKQLMKMHCKKDEHYEIKQELVKFAGGMKISPESFNNNNFNNIMYLFNRFRK
jgi:hypothetical protein